MSEELRREGRDLFQQHVQLGDGLRDIASRVSRPPA